MKTLNLKLVLNLENLEHITQGLPKTKFPFQKRRGKKTDRYFDQNQIVHLPTTTILKKKMLNSVNLFIRADNKYTL